MKLLVYLVLFITYIKFGYTYVRYETSGNKSHCIRKNVKCVTYQNLTCLGTPIPYSTISFDLIPDLIADQEYLMVQEKLHLLKSLKYIPKCWAVVQPLLCSLYMPKCTQDSIELPSYDMCNKISKPCMEVLNKTDIWPDFINCKNQDLFPKNCHKELYYREVKFNYTGKCLDPLVPTDNSLAMFEGVEGCGYPCSDPMYGEDVKNQIHTIIKVFAWIALICNFVTIATFLIEWKSSNKYPALAIFYINCCFLIANLGWLAQTFTNGNREMIVCRKDGTLRTNEPSGEHLGCVVVFIMIYYSMIAAMVWFVILTYSWYMKFTKCYGTMQDKLDKNSAYFHIIAWCLPLILTVSIMAIGEIDGNYVTGICFVGYNNHTARIWFVIIPVSIVFLTGGYFQCRALISLYKIRNSGREIISDQHRAKIETYMKRLGLFLFLSFFPIGITILCHYYEIQNSWEWKKSFRDFQLCSIIYKYMDINKYGIAKCNMQSKPNAARLQMHILAPFLMCIIMSGWIITGSTPQIWKRFFKRLIKRDVEPMKLTKQQCIAQAYAKKDLIIDNEGQFSISFHNTHEDPVGLNFDLNHDVATLHGDYMSPSWAEYLPKFVARRGAICDNDNSEMSRNRRNSTDSQLSIISLCQIAVGSRRNSCDSQFAQLSISEIYKTDYTATTNKNKGKRKIKRSKARSERLNRKSRKNVEKFSVGRRASTTSQDSQMKVQMMSLAVQLASATNGLPSPNMERRLGFDQGFLGSKQEIAKMLPYLDMMNPLDNLSRNEADVYSDENYSSERENNLAYHDVIRNNDNNLDGSDDSASEPEESTKMIEPARTSEISKSKNSNKSSKSKYKFEDKLQKSRCSSKKSKHDEKNEKSVGSDSVSSSSSYNRYRKSMQLDQSNAREISTQTFPMLDMLGIEKGLLCEELTKVLKNNRNISSKGTQMSPLLKKNKK